MRADLSALTDLEALHSCTLFLLDMDGTLYLGDHVYDGAVDFIRTLEETGRDYIYLTNNSSRNGNDYVTRLQRMGFPCEEKNVFTSGMATGAYLKEKYGDRPVYVLGTAAFHRELVSYGVNVINNPGDTRNIRGERKAEVVCAGFDTELVYAELDLAVHYLRRGADFIAANPDLVCPMPDDEVLPDCGSICQLLTAASGVKPYYIGKPNRSMVDVISSERHVENSRICCVGDRLYTDIAVAQNSGAVSLLVLSGETTVKDLEDARDKGSRLPDYVFDDVAEVAGTLRAQ